VAAVTGALRAVWPGPGDRHGPLVPLLLTLTVLSGTVDAASYLALGHVFVANMTGNIIFLGFALAGAHGVSSVSSLLALGSFLAGALAGGWLIARHREHRGRLLRAAGVAQIVPMAGAVVLAAVVHEPPAQPVRYALTVLLALALGLQNSAAQGLAVPDLTTTVVTRTLTGLASESSLVGGSGSKLGRRLAAVGAILLGALIGALLVLEVSLLAPLLFALALVAATTLAVHRLASSSESWTRGA
jgi:uncharacterized membrane protein YoaK (UPF0700 family)